MALEAERSGWDDSGVVILPIPYDGTTSWSPGTRFGPSAILDASRYIEWYDEELQSEPVSLGIHTLPEVEVDLSGPREAIAARASPWND